MTTNIFSSNISKITGDTFFILDKNGNYLDFLPSENFETYEPTGNLLGKNMKDILPEHLATLFFETIKDLFETNKTQITEYSMLKKDTTKYYEARLSIVEDNIVVRVRDITDNKNNSIYNERYKDLLRKAPFAFAHHKILVDDLEKPIDYEFLDVNEEFERQTSLKKENIINRKITEILPNIKNSDFDWISFYGETALKQLEKDFEQYSEPLKCWYKVKVYSTEKGYFTTVFQDITDLKTRELTFKDRSDKFYNLFELSPDSLILTNTSTNKIVDVNESFSKLTGYSKEESINKTTEDLNIWLDNSQRENFLKEIKEKGLVKNREYSFRTKGGKTIIGLLSTNIIKMNDELFSLGIVRDITEKTHLENKLKENEDKYSILVENASDGIFLANSTGKYIDVNSYGCKMLKYSKEEILNKNMSDLIPSQDLIKTPIKFKQLESHDIVISERDLICGDGSLLPVEISAKKLPNGNLLGIVRDITERKDYELKLNNEKIRLRTILDTIPDLLWLKDPNGVYLLCNKKVEELYEEKEENIIGKTDFDFYSYNTAISCIENDKKVIESRQLLRENEWITFLNTGNSIYGQTIKTPMYDSSENLIGVLGISRDITNIYLTEQKLHDREEIFSSIVNQANDSIALVDIETSKFVEFNEMAYKALGYTKEEFKKLTVKDVDADTNEKEVFDSFKQFKEDKSGIFETKHKTKDGRIIDVRVSTRYLKIKDKEYLSTIWSDITERKQIEQEIKKLNKILEEKVLERTIQFELANQDLESFAYSVSHDLRAPIRHINGFAKLLKSNIKEYNDEINRYFDKITEASNKMSKMIDGLLKFSKLGRTTLEKVDVDLNIIIKNIIKQQIKLIEDRKIEFKVEDLPIVKGDPSLLQMVFENIISNSIKFTSKKDSAIIEIGQCKNTSNNCTIYVKDNGIGFSMAYVDKLFGVFQRLHTENEFSGIGIGLANSKQIIKKHGGSIRAEGEIDKGATFYISL